MRNNQLIAWIACVVAIFVGGFTSANAGALRRGLKAFSHHDYSTAAALLRPFAERGNPPAQGCLCFLYAYGRGVPQNYPEAAAWCRRAANQGNPSAEYQLGLLYEKGQGVKLDVVRAYKWLNLAAANATGPKRDFAYRIRDAVATKMSRAQIAQGQRLALKWRPVRER